MTVALPGLPIIASALGLFKTSVRVLSPVNGVVLLIGITIDLDVESFCAQLSVPLVALVCPYTISRVSS